MLRFRGEVQYVDGTTETIECGNAALMMWERYAVRHKLPMGQESPPVLSSLVMAHAVLGIQEGFETWAATVDGIELRPVGDVPPTPEDPATA